MAAPAKRTTRKKKEPTAQEKQIKFHVSLRKRDTDLAEEYGRFEKGDWSARARELMYKGLMAERSGQDGSGGISTIQIAAATEAANEDGSIPDDRLEAILIENLNDNF